MLDFHAKDLEFETGECRFLHIFPIHDV